MANDQHFSRYQQGVVKHYYENRDTVSLQKLGEIVSDLFLCEDPKKTAKLWDRAAKALVHTDAQPGSVKKILADQDVAGLSQLVNQLSAAKPRRPDPSTPTATSVPAFPPMTPPAAPSQEPLDPTDAQVLKRAMKAFRKRLKLTRLDEESKLGVGPLSGGRRSGVVAITPPSQYPSAVWEELVRQGKLKRAGTGFYALPETLTGGTG